MDTRKRILEFIILYIKKYGYPPTVREIGEGVNLKSTSSVNSHLKKMLETGMIETDAGIGCPRAIRIPGMKYLERGKYSGTGWIPVEERFPKTKGYILLSFENFSIPLVGRFEEDQNGGSFFVGDEEESCSSQNMLVNAWRLLPKPYRPEEM